MRALAIVPAYNEQDSVAGVIEEIRRDAPGYDVVVIDDGSTDATAQIAHGAGARVVSLPYNMGIGVAVQTGYQFACDHGYELAVQVDGDGQHIPAEIAKLASRLTADPPADLVYGSRFLEQGGYRSSLLRRAGIKVFSTMLSMATRRRVTDPTSGFRLANRRTIELFAADYPHDYPEVEAILMMHAHELQIAEVPVKMRPREGGRSSINLWRSAYYMLKVTLALVVGMFRSRRMLERRLAAARQDDASRMES
jgi:glycosyltransferase involved in cell wall biosynthesis